MNSIPLLIFCIIHYIVEIAARKHRRYNLKVVNSETKEILNELDSTYVKPVGDDNHKTTYVNLLINRSFKFF